MLSEDDISRQCPARTLARAQSIAASDRNILTKQVRYNPPETTLSAFVASSSGWNDRYRTSVTFDEAEGAVVDYACTCPAYREHDGMCKHCAALALSYLSAPEKFMGYRAHRAPTTSTGLLEFMERSRAAAEAEEAGGIDLEPTIVYGYRSWSAHFRIVGPQGGYVMKSISDFVGRMRRGERFSYGKKLAFTHVPALLAERARPIERFLDRAVALREQATGSAFWRYRGRDEIGRDLDLSDYELIELLDLLDGRPFTVEGTDCGTRSLTHAHVVSADPDIDVRVERTDEDGYAIVQPDELPFVAQGDRMYLWQGDAFYRCSADFARTAGFLRTAYDSDDARLFVSLADMPLFCATVLPAIERRLHVETPPEIELFRPVPCKLEFYFDKTDHDVTCAAQAVYGARRYPLFDAAPDDEAGPLRDERLEGRAKNLVKQYFDTFEEPPAIKLGDESAVADLVFGGLVEFQALGEAFTTPAFDRLLADKKPRLSVGISLAGNLINLTVSADDLPPAEVAALLASYRRRKRYHRLKSGAYLNLAEYDLAQLDHLVDDFGFTPKQLAAGQVELPAYHAFYLDEQFDDAQRNRSFTRYLESFRAIEGAPCAVPEQLAATLRPYQAEGLRWMSALADRDLGGILADEMGLGKSVQLIAFLLARRSEARAVGPSLIVCPASLVYNWVAEFERFAPDLDVRAAVGTKRERMRIRAEACDRRARESGLARDGRCCDVLITSYDLLRIDADDVAERTFYCCALDEAQYVKNHATKTARAAKRVQARHRFALTGTPMENRLSELWSIFDFLMPGLLGSYMRFREHFELDITGGDEDAARRLRSLVAPFMLRRLKADVLKDLPDKLESVVYVPMEGEQQRLYAAHEQQLRDALTLQKNNRNNRQFRERKVEILAELTKLRQLCCDPRLLYENYAGHAAKLDAIAELVESAMDAGEKTLVFSQFTSFLQLIADVLDAHDVPYFTITGATPKKRRLELVNLFNDDDTPVFLVSLKAGGTGLNLTGASVVVHADPWWNAAAQNQATDRAHRIGQTQVVSVHKVIAKDTIEERILHLQDAKTDLADQVIGAGGVSLATLSQEELLDLLES